MQSVEAKIMHRAGTNSANQANTMLSPHSTTRPSIGACLLQRRSPN